MKQDEIIHMERLVCGAICGTDVEDLLSNINKTISYVILRMYASHDLFFSWTVIFLSY